MEIIILQHSLITIVLQSVLVCMYKTVYQENRTVYLHPSTPILAFQYVLGIQYFPTPDYTNQFTTPVLTANTMFGSTQVNIQQGSPCSLTEVGISYKPRQRCLCTCANQKGSTVSQIWLIISEFKKFSKYTFITAAYAKQLYQQASLISQVCTLYQ